VPPSKRRNVVELAPDIYVSSIRVEDWEPDTDPPGEVHVLVDSDELGAGFWRPSPGVTPETVEWSPPTREVVLVLKGEATIEIKDGPTLKLNAGSVASLPAGARASWRCTPDFLEFWVLDARA
jgi:uncharacterized cupin superfamily protein